VEWLNSFGTLESNLTPEKVKNLFSIKGDRTLLASVKTDPKEVNAIAQTVADKWNKPHVGIQRNKDILFTLLKYIFLPHS